MKYFGNKSLSSWLSAILNVSWYVVLVGAIAGTVIGAALMVLLSVGNALASESGGESSKILTMISSEMSNSPEAGQFEQAQVSFGTRFRKFKDNLQGKDRKDFEAFVNLPAFVKVLMFPYFWIVVILLLKIIKKSRLLFENFKNNILFTQSNVLLLSRISKLNIVFSILTFSLSSLLMSVFLLMGCEIFRNATALQQEHDLTV